MSERSFTSPSADAPPAARAGYKGRGPVRLQTLVLTRWIALAGQAAAIVAVRVGFQFEMPFVAALLAVLASVVLNAFLTLRYSPTTRLSDAQAALYLGYDTLQLAVLLYLTGGIQNPFSILMLVPVTVSATILSLRSTVLLGALAVLSLTTVTVFHLPLPWRAEGIDLPWLYVAGIWVSLVLGMVFIAIYAWRVAAEARRMADALAETQFALAREQQLSSLGGLAAAAAHELGTPLSTIAVIAREMQREVRADDVVLAEDLDLLLKETERCRQILAQLSRDPRGDAGSPLETLALPALIESIVSARRSRAVAIEVYKESPDAAMPLVARRPEIVHGIGNIVENAVDFARSRVVLTLAADERNVRITVEDDGAGFSHSVLGDLGEPYISTRSGADGMGLGLFIAKTLLERTGAALAFSNRPAGGAAVEIGWRRDMLEAEAT